MKIAVFVDYWNFQLTLNGALDNKAQVDWKGLGELLSRKSCETLSVDPANLSYEGCYIYTSFNPSTPEGRKFRKWATTWLDRQPGINVEVRARRPKALPRCPTCHVEITHCPHENCREPIVATTEKGIDTLLVTDLIRLGFTDTYDAAVLVSSDADMEPAVNFVQTSGKKVIQAGFPPAGVFLATKCWGSFDVMDLADKIQR